MWSPLHQRPTCPAGPRLSLSKLGTEYNSLESGPSGSPCPPTPVQARRGLEGGGADRIASGD